MRPHPALVDLAAGRRLPAVTDPGWLVDSAFEHRMHGLLHSAQRRRAVDLPAPAAEALAGADLLTRRHAEGQWAALDRVVAVASEHGVPLAVVKGVAFEHRWYDRAGERPASDVDVFVDPSRAHRAAALVAALQPDHPLGSHLAGLVTSRRQQAVEVRVADVAVDIHFDVLKIGVPSRAVHRIWERGESWTSPTGSQLRVLDPSAELLHLLVHLNKDRFRTLLGMVDVARLVDRASPDWSEVFALARLDGLDVVVDQSARVVAEELGRDLRPTCPAGSGTSAPHRAGRDHRALLWRLIWPRRLLLQGELGVVAYRQRQALMPLTMPGRAREALRWWLRKLFPLPALVDYRNPDQSGGYATKLLAGRLRRAIARRRLVAQARRSSPRTGG